MCVRLLRETFWNGRRYIAVVFNIRHRVCCVADSSFVSFTVKVPFYTQEKSNGSTSIAFNRSVIWMWYKENITLMERSPVTRDRNYYCLPLYLNLSGNNFFYATSKIYMSSSRRVILCDNIFCFSSFFDQPLIKILS